MYKKYVAISLVIIFIVMFIIFKKNYGGSIILEENLYGSTDFIKINSASLNKKIADKKSFVVFVYNNFCSLPIPCEEIFSSYQKNNNIAFYSIKYDDYKETVLNEEVKYAPSIIIVSKGKIIDYLDANKDEDTDKYQKLDAFTEWINKYLK